MANKKISQLTTTTEVALLDYFPSARFGQNYAINFEQLSYTGITALELNNRILAGTLIPAHWYAITAGGTSGTLQYYVQATAYDKIHPTAHFNFNGEWQQAQIYDPQQDPLYLLNPLGNWLGSPDPLTTTGSNPTSGTNFPIESRFQFRNNQVSDQTGCQIQNKSEAVLVADNIFQAGNNLDVRRVSVTQSKLFGVTLLHTSAPGPGENIILNNCNLSNVTIYTDGTNCQLWNVTAQNCVLNLTNNVSVYNCNIFGNYDLGLQPTYTFDGNFQGFVTDGWAGTIVTGVDDGFSTIRMNCELDNFYDALSNILNLPPDFPVGIYQFTNGNNLTGPFTINTILGGTIFHEITLRWAPLANSNVETIQLNYQNNPSSTSSDEICKYNQFATSLTQLIYEGDHVHLQRNSNDFSFWLLKGGNHYH